MFDLVVIGGGLAGTLAALAARAEGAQVAMANRSYGATALSTGAGSARTLSTTAISPAAAAPRRAPHGCWAPLVASPVQTKELRQRRAHRLQLRGALRRLRLPYTSHRCHHHRPPLEKPPWSSTGLLGI